MSFSEAVKIYPILNELWKDKEDPLTRRILQDFIVDHNLPELWKEEIEYLVDLTNSTVLLSSSKFKYFSSSRQGSGDGIFVCGWGGGWSSCTGTSGYNNPSYLKKLNNNNDSY